LAEDCPTPARSSAAHDQSANPTADEPISRAVVLDARFERVRGAERVEIREIRILPGHAVGLHTLKERGSPGSTPPMKASRSSATSSSDRASRQRSPSSKVDARGRSHRFVHAWTTRTDTHGVGELVVVSGPIAAGKSTVAAAVGAIVGDAGLSAAVVDLDEIVASLRAPGAPWQRSWGQARRAHAALIGGWLRSGVEVVLADGPFHDSSEIATLLSEVPAGTVTRWCWLDVAYDVARRRTAADPTRGLSRDPAFLRHAHDHVAALIAERPTATWTFDTQATSLDIIVAAIADDLLTGVECSEIPTR